MRIGTNPAKTNNKIEAKSYHRIIIPVFIPNLDEDYFIQSLVILKLTIESILKSIHSKTRISIFNNGSCEAVSQYLEKIFEAEASIDQFINNKENVGKINAIYAVVKSNIEPLFTITDADVLFKRGWQQEVEKVFEHFPKAGIVSPVPFSTLYSSDLARMNLWEGLVRSKLHSTPVPNPNGLKHFEKSIGRAMFKEIHYQQFITLEHSGKKAVLGSGHFVCTVRAQVFQMAPTSPTTYKMGGEVMADYFDKPNRDAGFLRLATLGNYAYHIGNRMESWLEKEVQMLKETNSNDVQINEQIDFNVKPYSALATWMSKVFYILFIKTSFGKRLFLKYVGIKNYNY